MLMVMSSPLGVGSQQSSSNCGVVNMLDVHFVRENLDRVKANCKNRTVNADVDGVLALDDRRKQFASRRQTIQQRQNELSKLIPAEKDKEKKQALVAEAKQLREQVGDLEKQE